MKNGKTGIEKLWEACIELVDAMVDGLFVEYCLQDLQYNKTQISHIDRWIILDGWNEGNMRE